MKVNNNTLAFWFLCFSGIILGLTSALILHPPIIDKVVIGIDLGTTYSCVGIYKNNHFERIVDDQGYRLTPSWVAFTDTEVLIGEAAKYQAHLNAERTIFHVKSLIGRKFDDPVVQKDIEFLPYKVVNKQGKPHIQVMVNGETKTFSAEEISAMILGRMKERAEAYLGRRIKDVVITVPAYFNEAQKQATRDAGSIAGLNVVRIIDEPTAAAISYGLDKKRFEENMNVLVYQLGGGTFDVSILSIDDGVFEVLATNGDTHLGGEDFDHRMVDYFIKLIKKKYKKDISGDNKALAKLTRECERAKIELSMKNHVRVQVESIFDGLDISESLTRARFEELNADLFKKTLGPVKKALADAGLEKIDIHEIVLVGGSSRIPKVRQLLKDFFYGKEPNKGVGVNPDEAVAYGAAVQGEIISAAYRDDFLLPREWFNIDSHYTRPPLSEEEIVRMVKEAEEFAEKEAMEREKTTARNKLETYIHNNMRHTKFVTKFADYIDSKDKQNIQGALEEATEWLGQNQGADKIDYEEKLKEVELLVRNPIIRQRRLNRI